MKCELSILMPAYNTICTDAVRQLVRQAETIEGLHYELLVADDGSTDQQCVEANRAIDGLPHCRYIIKEVNVGRAAIRNFLAREAHYEWLLYIDADLSITRPDYLQSYLATADDAQVYYGGYHVGMGDKHNLRYRYEKAAEPHHTAVERSKRPYQHFHTSNFMVKREVMLQYPFDERFHTYGYEDVLFGKTLRLNGIAVSHIDNTVGFCRFEDNGRFVSKTEEGLRTLYQFRNDLRGYSTLLTFVEGIHLGFVRVAIRLWYGLFGPLVRRNLCSRHPCVALLKYYKIGYYMKMKDKNSE